MSNHNSLDNLKIQIEDTVKQIMRLFRTIHVPENSLAIRDRMWGLRAFPMHVNLDELSIQNLESVLPQLAELHRQFQEFRREERRIQDQLEIESQTRRNVVNQSRYTPY